MIKIVHRFLWKIKACLAERYRRAKYKKKIKDNAVFKNAFFGKSCIIVCNGPSLTITDLERINDKKIITFGCNKISKLLANTNWCPDFYCVCDPKLVINNKNDIMDIVAKTKASFFPLDMMVEEQYPNIHYFSRVPFQFFGNKPRFSNNLCAKLHEGGTVTYFMLQIAAYMGFKKIYLIGCDFSFSFGIDVNGKRFSNKSVKNHSDLTGGDTLDTMPNLQYNLNAYQSAKRFSEKKGFSIFNATRGGKLEVFARTDLDVLLDSNDF